jgi:hypothetical protein
MFSGNANAGTILRPACRDVGWLLQLSKLALGLTMKPLLDFIAKLFLVT